MLVVETIGKVRRDYLVKKKGIKAIARDHHLSWNAKRNGGPKSNLNVCAWAGRAGWRAMRVPERYLCPHRSRGTLGSFRAPIKQCGNVARLKRNTQSKNRMWIVVSIVVGGG